MWQPIDLDAAYTRQLDEVQAAIHAGQHNVYQDGTVWLDDDDITEVAVDLIQSGRLTRAEVNAR